METDQICAWFAVIGGALSTFIGGYDMIMHCLLLVMLLDIVAGVLCAAVFKTSKYTPGNLSSSALFKGSVRKIAMLSIVALGVVIDKAMSIDYVRNGVVMYFIATEGLSLLEHMVTIGVPVPDFVRNLLESMEDKNNGGGPDAAV